MRLITRKEFANLKKSDKIFVKCGGNMYSSKVVASPFWNSDADEPGWEVETTNGFCDEYSIYVEKN